MCDSEGARDTFWLKDDNDELSQCEDPWAFRSGCEYPRILRLRRLQEKAQDGEGGSLLVGMDRRGPSVVASVTDGDHEGEEAPPSFLPFHGGIVIEESNENNSLKAEDLSGKLQNAYAALLEVQRQIYVGEEAYHDETHGHGNMFRGWEGFIDLKILAPPHANAGGGLACSSLLTGSSNIIGAQGLGAMLSNGSLLVSGGTANKRRMTPDDRWFSGSSAVSPFALDLASRPFSRTNSAANVAALASRRQSSMNATAIHTAAFEEVASPPPSAADAIQSVKRQHLEESE